MYDYATSYKQTQTIEEIQEVETKIENLNENITELNTMIINTNIMIVIALGITIIRELVLKCIK